jgi:hypothetical protein
MKVFLGFLVGAVLGLVVGLHGTSCPFLVKLCPYVQGRVACVCPADCPCVAPACEKCNCCGNCPCADCKDCCKPNCCQPKKKSDCKPNCCKPEVLPKPNVEEAPKKMPPAKD